MKKININKKKTLKAALIFAGVTAVLFVILTLTVNVLMERITHSSREVIVPNITGKTLNEALDILAEKNLSLVKVADQYNTQIPAGSIISQTPSAGFTVREGRAIDIVISAGGKVVFVPDIEGKSIRQAELMLRQANLAIGEQSRTYSDDLRKDFVVSQSPPPGEITEKNSYVNIVISRGPAEEDSIQKMPNLLGLDVRTAEKRLAAYGLKLDRVEYEINEELDEGTVIGQEPKEGVKISEESSVSLKATKRERSEKEVRDATVYWEVTQSGQEKEIEIKIKDKLGTRTVFKEKTPPGSKISQPVKVMGEAQAQIYIDGDLAETIELKMDSEEPEEAGQYSEEELYPGRGAETYPEVEEALPEE